jgi:DNA-binding SARP family transcriptional activator
MSEALTPLAIRCLGPPSVRVDGHDAPPDVVWRKHLALLVYLALSPETTRARAHLVGLLWAESPDDKARRSLNEAVRRLRTALGEERLLTRGDGLQLSTAGLELDVREFDALCADGQLRALELLRGDFLEGFHVDDAPAFDAWMETERSRLREAARRLVVARAEEQLAVNRYVEARALARRALALDPYSDVALSLAMRSAALEGDPASGVALYQEFAERLERDLGGRPSPQLTALATRIRESKWQRPRVRHPDREPPLIGRRDSHARLFAELERVPREGSACLVIAGEPGSGRTRLLDACAERLALAGATVATARILESDHDAPWSTLRALMRGGLLEAQGIAATDHLGLRLLAGIVPELATRVEPVDAHDVAQVSDALASLLRAVAEEQPVALIIDDAQWADGATLAALRAAWAREQEAPIALVLTLDPSLDLSTELQGLSGSVGREVRGTFIRLEPLAAEEIVALTEAMAPWCTIKEDRERLARRVAQESGGNPLLAVTLLRDLGDSAPERRSAVEWPRPGATYDSTLPVQISAVVRSAITARVARLDEDALAVVRAASVGGEVLDSVLIAEVLELPPARIDAALDRLERERFVVFAGDRYAFNGQLVRAVVESECIQAGGRRRLRERHIAALATRDDIDSRLLRARLLVTERHPDGFEAARSVTERALAVGARRTAAGALHLAERAANGSPERLALLEPLRQRTDAVVAQ